MNEGEKTYVWAIIFSLAIVTYFMITVLSGCTSAQKPDVSPVNPIVTISPLPSPLPIVTIPALSWENTIAPHPERKPWSKLLWQYIEQRFDHLDKAKDMNRFCPKYANLSHVQKVQAWSELFVALTYYESAYDPENESVDVGDESDRNTWSVGLLQVSQTDIVNYKIKDMKYSYKDLLTVGPNLDLGTALMANQIDKVGTILIGPGRSWLYWATLHPYGMYDESERIITRVQKLPFCK